MTEPKQPKPTHGGKRDNAGRQTLDGATKPKRRSLTLDDKTIDKAALIGAGNVSEGVRIAVKKFLPD